MHTLPKGGSLSCCVGPCGSMEVTSELLDLALSLAIRLRMVAGGQAHSAHFVMVSTTE